MATTSVAQTVCDICGNPAVNKCQRCGKDLCKDDYTQTVGGGFNGVVLCPKCRYGTEPEFQAVVDTSIADKGHAVTVALVSKDRQQIAATQTDLAETMARIA